jgi:hypothetical protein
MAANNKCSDCGNDREPKYKNDSCCKACRYKRNRAKRDAQMLAKGKRPVGSGRHPNCSSCGKPKEPGRENESRCKSCKSEAYKASRAKKRLEQGMRPLGSGRDPLCYKCKKPKENPNHGYCNSCHSRTERDARLRNKLSVGFIERERTKVNDRYKTDAEFRLKKNVRLITLRAIRAGILLRKPCEVCGKEKVDAHHDDYMKPLDVRWLCRKHHNEHHRNNG